ncbi:hypothetical protein N7481_003528 [Penicillium waksmanii]|uniref:uncharacterized protein n=1 Tax=Penicillium waksmanii TaxID=69791 RepID=UPI002548C22A|nr:uncharacterized protein N7481_003528 [Penicillium waksmanii]KAJ5988318.1 hypothetical protein N7481_003528 [Penicillium waksmanii]
MTRCGTASEKGTSVLKAHVVTVERDRLRRMMNTTFIVEAVEVRDHLKLDRSRSRNRNDSMMEHANAPVSTTPRA